MARDPVKRKAAEARYRERNRAAVRARVKLWQQQNPERYTEKRQDGVRRFQAKRDGYAPPPRECDCPPRPADNRCQCCHEVVKLCLDHDHETGLFRGWICKPCNTGIGRSDDIRWLILKISYLQRHYNGKALKAVA